MAEPTPAPDCPPCDHCCKACCSTVCDCFEDCEYRIVFLPDDLPDEAHLDCCVDSVAMEDRDDNCGPMEIKACCNGLDGCDNRRCKNVLWRICNKTNRCINVSTTFRISNLRSGRTPNPVCPDEDTDCCMLQYRGSFSSECKWNEPGTVFEPNGIAPGPGFCMEPCSEASICVNMRVGTPAGECGCKKYSDSIDSDKVCCEAIARLVEPCATLCCVDEYAIGCNNNCADALFESDPPVVCPPCCGCCEPSQQAMNNDGWTIVSNPTNCCTDLVVKVTDTSNWECCENGDCNLADPPTDTCEADIDISIEEYACNDADNEFCYCLLEPVPNSHPEYIAPCVCDDTNVLLACFGGNDNCKWGTAYVFQGSDSNFNASDCCYNQEFEKEVESCAVSPCSFLDTANSPCLH